MSKGSGEPEGNREIPGVLIRSRDRETLHTLKARLLWQRGVKAREGDHSKTLARYKM